MAEKTFSQAAPIAEAPSPATTLGNTLARLAKAEERIDYLERALKAFVQEYELTQGRVDRARIFPEQGKGGAR